MIEGYCSHRLGEIKTYNRETPYQVGINGVIEVNYDINGNLLNVVYIIDSIKYTTLLNNTSYITTFTTNLSGNHFVNYPFFKEESKMGLVFQPKVEDEIFIERQVSSAFEPQSRLSEITSVTQLMSYRNEYYNIRINN